MLQGAEAVGAAEAGGVSGVGAWPPWASILRGDPRKVPFNVNVQVLHRSRGDQFRHKHPGAA